MFDIQCLLDKEGASELVIDVIVNTKNDRIFSEGILLGIALLEGGNTQTQVLISFTYSHIGFQMHVVWTQTFCCEFCEEFITIICITIIQM